MMYLAEVNIVEHINVDAESMEEAFEVAADEVAKAYDVDRTQVSVSFVKEVK